MQQQQQPNEYTLNEKKYFFTINITLCCVLVLNKYICIFYTFI